ncbi:MAG TPA: NADH dehydrogenase (quinone) subunit D [Gemmatimonadaceae bacterium]|nr:NADH dehydrogenase (quinone) subunit D [Gemmatimonadaceae bacterium]
MADKRTVEVSLSTSGLDAQGRPQRTPLVVDDGGRVTTLEAPPAMEPELEGEHMLINIGPQHPATHGVLRLVLELDGETVVRCIPHVGYLHCGFEKIGEYRQYNQIIPWTDREDYLNSPGNNVAFALGAERLFGVEITPRCTVLRVITCELSRIMSHLVWLGTTCIDIGAFTPFLWSFQERERIYTLLEQWCGARLTTSLTRVGGMLADIPDGWMDGLNDFIRTFPKTIAEVDRMVTRNGIWVGRTIGIGAMSGPDAVNAGLSGPMVRASGVAYDVRKDFPYLDYETYDFDVPIGTSGDVYDRFLVRMEEMRQSVRILEQASARLPDGPVNIDDPRLILPPKSKATSEMESMIHHFKQVMEGPRPPIGECYVAVESPKGEKGYYFVSDGTPKPVRWRIRPPSYVNLSAIPRMVEGHLLSDVIAINASIDIVMGEIDR